MKLKCIKKNIKPNELHKNLYYLDSYMLIKRYQFLLKNKRNNQRYYLHRKVKEQSMGIKVNSFKKEIMVPHNIFQDGLPDSLDKYSKRLQEKGYSIQSYLL